MDLVAVRRRDVKRLRQYGQPMGVQLPYQHGAKGDPRYPSPTTARAAFGFVLDLVIHVGAAVAAAMAFGVIPAIATFLVASIVHRTILQWAFQTTLGKAVTGLQMIRNDTGTRPTLWDLIKAWIFGVFAIIASAF
jgi:hypothetical protein